MAERSRTAGRGAEAKWARRVERLERSGLSIRTFAAREGLPAGSLSSWKWKLAQRRRRAPGADSRQEAPLRFVELKAAAGASTAEPTTTTTFEVVLDTGRVVRVRGGFDAAELVRLVGVLEEVRS
jgi:hypothetical protein